MLDLSTIQVINIAATQQAKELRKNDVRCTSRRRLVVHEIDKTNRKHGEPWTVPDLVDFYSRDDRCNDKEAN